MLSKLGSLLTGGFVKEVGNIVDKFVQTPEEKGKLMLELEQVFQKRDSEIEQTVRAELEAKSEVIIAELNQSDNYTKRARPTVTYFGLLVILYNYCIVPTIQLTTGVPIEPFNLPTEFWIAWGGVVGVYAIGRSAEKSGVVNRGTQLMTGSNKLMDRLLK